jgi:hypothetical protein
MKECNIDVRHRLAVVLWYLSVKHYQAATHVPRSAAGDWLPAWLMSVLAATVPQIRPMALPARFLLPSLTMPQLEAGQLPGGS